MTAPTVDANGRALCFVADIYHLNPVDFGKLKAARYNGIACEAIIHKASQGTGVADPAYAQRRPGALAAGFLWGAYAFNTGEPVKAQVAEYLKVAAPDAQTALFLDFEDNSKSEMTLPQAVEFLDRVEQAVARHCRLYSGNRLKTLIVHATDAQRDFLAADRTRLWGCEYDPVFKDTDDAGKPLPWPAPFLWQDTGDGIGPQPHTLDGLQAGADLSIFKGTRDQLAAAWAGLPLQPAAAAPAPAAVAAPPAAPQSESIGERAVEAVESLFK
jgi:GH25 family lysozyme M1 (1,4-beta-N-acetylmuramidase)